MNLEEMVRTQRPYIDSFTCPGEYDAGEAEILAEIGRLRKELEAERTVRETCARVADQLQAALEAHRRFHGKVGCPGKPECYVCEADAPTPTEPASGWNISGW